jgi:hypothetical protein
MNAACVSSDRHRFQKGDVMVRSANRKQEIGGMLWFAVTLVVTLFLSAAQLTQRAYSEDKKDKEKATKSDFTVKAEDLSKEFKKDRQAALKKYNRKTIKVTGVVNEITEDLGHITLKGCEGGGDVVCFVGKDSPILKKVKLNKPATFQGAFDDVFSGRILIEKCRLIESK